MLLALGWAMATKLDTVSEWLDRARRDTQDTLPEWSKGVDSSSTSASCVGSNPTGVICLLTNGYRHRNNTASVTKRRLVQVPTNKSDQRKAIEMSVCPSG